MELVTEFCILITACIIAAMVIMPIQSKRWMAKQMTARATYIVRCLPFYIGIMVIGIAFIIILIWAFILAEGPDIGVLLIFLSLLLFCLMVYFCILFWGIVVHEDKGILVYYRPPFPPRRVRISEITKVQFLENRIDSIERYRIRVFQHGQKLLEASDAMQNFYLLAEYLSENEADAAKEPDLYRQYDYGKYTIEAGYFRQGSIETAELTDDFSVMEKPAKKVGGGMLTLFILVTDLFFVWNWKEWSRGEPYYWMLVAVNTLSALIGAAVSIPWMLRRVSVCNHRISVRDGIGRTRSYDAGEISNVEKKRDYLILYAGGKRIAKVSKDNINFASFEAWVYRELERVSRDV